MPAETLHAWIDAAACHETPPAAVRFHDLPKAHRHDIVRIGLAAAASSAFFIGVAVLLLPLRSRSMVSTAQVPHPVPIRAALLEAPNLPDETPPMRVRQPRQRQAIQTVALVEPVETPEPPQNRRRNIFSRLWRGLVRRPAPTVAARLEPAS